MFNLPEIGELREDDILLDLPILRESISYSSVAADALKDILIITDTWVIILRADRLFSLPNLSYDDNPSEISIDKVKSLLNKKSKVKTLLFSQISDLIKVEVSKLKKHGNWLSGNKLYGYEIRFCTKNNSVSFLVSEITADNLLNRINIIIPDKTFNNVTSFTCKSKKRNFAIKYSGVIIFFLTKLFVFFVNVILLASNSDLFLSSFNRFSTAIGESTFVKVLLFWSYYRLIMNFFYRVSYKESRKKKIKSFTSDKQIFRIYKNKIIGNTLKSIGLLNLMFFLTMYGIHIGHRINIRLGINSYIFSQFLLECVGYCSLALVYIGYILTKRTYIENKKNNLDQKKNVLYLRSFLDDDNYSFNTGSPITLAFMGIDVPIIMKSVYTKWVANWHPLRMLRVAINAVRDSAEEQLIYHLVREGYNIIALGRPQEIISPGGADRIYLSHKDWQVEVESLIKSSDIILIQPGTTNGVNWEILQAINKRKLNELLFIFPNNNYSNMIYENLSILLKRYLSITDLPVKYSSDFFLSYTTDNKFRWLETFNLQPYMWPLEGHTINFTKTLKPFFQNSEYKKNDKRNVNYNLIAFFISIFVFFMSIGAIMLPGKLVSRIYTKNNDIYNLPESKFLYSSLIDTRYAFYNELVQKDIKQNPISFVINPLIWKKEGSYLLGTKYLSNNRRYTLEYTIQPAYGDFVDLPVKGYNIFQAYTGDMLDYITEKGEKNQPTYIEHVNNKFILSLKQLKWKWHFFNIIDFQQPDKNSKYELKGIALLKQIRHNQIILVKLTKRYKGLLRYEDLAYLIKTGFIIDGQEVSIELPGGFYNETKFKIAY